MTAQRDRRTYHLDAIEHCRTAVAGQVGPLAAAGDDLPVEPPAGVFGDLPGAAELASALSAFCTGIRAQFDAGSDLLDGVNTVLDGIGRSVTDIEDVNTDLVRSV